MSRDTSHKHHPRDLVPYRELADERIEWHRHGGYADWIEHGHNGLWFDNNEAKALLKRLANDSNERLAFYLAPPRHGLPRQTG